jgi:hypothetical protein
VRYGKKVIILIDQAGNQIGPKRRYKLLRTAVRRAVEICYETKGPVQIWDTDRGMDYACAVSQADNVRLCITRPRLFNQLWNSP